MTTQNTIATILFATLIAIATPAILYGGPGIHAGFYDMGGQILAIVANVGAYYGLWTQEQALSLLNNEAAWLWTLAFVLLIGFTVDAVLTARENEAKR